MLFNSLDFAIFFPIVLTIYWFFKSNRVAQNYVLLFASYIFYGWWDWRFLTLIFMSSLVDFSVGLKVARAVPRSTKRKWLIVSIFFNIGLLFVFKYFNFFIESFVDSFNLLGSDLNITTLNVILPVGISFYTFQTLSYSIDIYRKKLKPTHEIIDFFSFVSFFPQLVAGPIERASNLLPQFHKIRKISYVTAKRGVLLIIWGLFKKVVIADNMSSAVNDCFADPHLYGSITLVLGAIFFAFQIYGDFSGYTDMAIGIALLFGFKLMKNFNLPYFSRDIAEFWRRWHISLSSWFRDYVYIPLGGSRGRLWNKIRNIFVVFLVSGFWHGANWTFIFWGALNAIYFLPLLFLKMNRKHIDIVASNSFFPTPKDIILILSTFSLTTFAWIFFRASSISDALSYINAITSNHNIVNIFYFRRLVLILLLVSIEWFNRNREFAFDFSYLPRILQVSIVVIIVDVIILFGDFGYNEFIYFQF